MSGQPAVTHDTITTKHGALAEMRAKREQDGTRLGAVAEPATNPVSDAARQLGQRSAEVRRQGQQPGSQGRDGQQPAQRLPIADKGAQQAPHRSAPERDKPEAAEDNAEDEAAPEGQDAVEEQTDTAEAEADGQDGREPTIEIDGEKLTAQEIRDSYLRREDYTKKTQEVAEDRKQLQARIGAVTQNSQRIEQLVGMLEQAVGQEPDWNALMMQMQQRPNGAMEFLAYKENWNQQRQVLNNVMAEKNRNFQASINQAKQTMMDEAVRTFRPEWQDREKMQEGVRKLADFAVSKGILPEELQQLHRASMLNILDDAFRWNELQKSKSVTDKMVRNKPKPVRPGAQGLRANAAESQLQSERQIWESAKHPDTRTEMRWIKAKRAYTEQTGKNVPR